MKILLDENIQRRMKRFLIGDFQVFTLNDMGWLGYQNGVLREKLNENSFEFFITADKNLPFQQNLNKANFTVILLDSPASAWRFHTLLVPIIQDFLQNAPLIRPKLVLIQSENWENERLIENLKLKLPSDQILFI